MLNACKCGLFTQSQMAVDSKSSSRPPPSYVDDTFIVLEHDLQEHLEHINGLHERILFTMEVEENNKISFLDVLVERKSHPASTSVYGKPTHTERYLSYI